MLTLCVGVVRSGVVGSEEEQIAVLAHLRVESIEELLDVAVEREEHLLVLLARRAPCTGLVRDGIGRRDAYAEHVGSTVLSELLGLHYCLSHVECHGHTVGMYLRVVALLHGVLLVELHHIVGQLVHIVRAGDKSSHALVIPESAVGRMARRQNGSTVLYSHAENLGLEVCSLAQHVAYSGAEHVVGRHLCRLRRSAYALH